MRGVGAIILAAGKSSRMGQCKAVMPLGQQCVLEHLFAALQGVGVDKICVVTGFHRERLVPFIQGRLNVFEARNPHPEKGMFSSLCVGVEAMAQSCSAMFVLPVDIPLVRPCTFCLVQEQWQKRPESIVLPFLGEASGHPPLVPSSQAKNILGWSGDMGLRGFCASGKARIVPVQVADEHMLMDMDTPTAYEEILTAWQGFALPSRKECLALLQKVCSLPENIVAHSLMVAALARLMGKTLNQQGYFFDLALLEASGLLHDIARLEPHHGPRGAEMLRAMGFGKVAEVIVSHSDMDIPQGSPITPQEIIFLADKYFQGDKPVSLTTRYGAKMKQYGTNPSAREHINQRLAHARHAEARFQKQTGMVLTKLVMQVAGNKTYRGL